MKNFKLLSILSLSIILVFTSGCKEDFLDTQSGENVTGEQLAASATANQVLLNGVYAALRTYGIGNNGGHIDYGYMATLNANEMMGHDIAFPAFHWWGFYYNYDGRLETSSRTQIQWETYYSQIKELNVVINGIDPATADDAGLGVLGQAQALRAMMYHVLARWYSHSYTQPSALCVPLQLGTTGFDDLPRATVQEVYDQIIEDLENAVSNLENYSRSTKQEVDWNVANGFLARAYLEVGRYSDAATAANDARSGYSYMSNSSYLSGFSDINNSSVMWGSDIDSESSTIFASFFSHFDNLNNGYAGALGVYKHIDADLYGQIPATDIRLDAYVAPGDPLNYGLPDLANVKFVDPTFFEGDYIYMRPAEMMFIEAEALARSANEPGAKAILDDIVGTRDASYTTSANTGQALLDEIHLQKRIELWGEGHVGLWELNRLGKVMDRTYSGSNHGSYALLTFAAGADERIMQLPEEELQANSLIGDADQNP